MDNNQNPQGNQQTPPTIQGRSLGSFSVNPDSSIIPPDLSDGDLVNTPANETPVQTLKDNDPIGGAQQPNNEPSAQEPPAQEPQAQDPSADPNAQEPQKPAEPQVDPYEDFSTSAKFALALKESGLGLYGNDDINKELDPQTFAGDIQTYIETSREEAVNQQLQQIGPLANFVQFLYRGGNLDDINPAIQAQRYADFNLDDPNVTEEQLEGIAREMYVKKGIDPEEANDFIAIAKEKDRLKTLAGESKQYHAQLVEQFTANAQQAYQREQQMIQAQRQQDAAKYASVLEGGDILGIKITRDQAGDLYDFMWNRSQAVDTLDNNGNPTRDFATRYEIAMHNAVNDPNKLALLSFLAYNDFSLDAIMKVAQTKVSTSIFDSLNNPDAGVNTPQKGNQGGQGRQGITSTKIGSFSI
jgi:hypothetical protein